MTKDEIIRIVCEVCGVEAAHLTRKCKKEDISTARHLIAYYLYSKLNYMPQKIAPIIGTTVAYVYKPLFKNTVQDRAKSDAEFRERLNAVEEKLFN
jgi:chromosomal replication initiation ATPase DnaA